MLTVLVASTFLALANAAAQTTDDLSYTVDSAPPTQPPVDIYGDGPGTPTPPTTNPVASGIAECVTLYPNSGAGYVGCLQGYYWMYCGGTGEPALAPACAALSLIIELSKTPRAPSPPTPAGSE